MFILRRYYELFKKYYKSHSYNRYWVAGTQLGCTVYKQVGKGETHWRGVRTPDTHTWYHFRHPKTHANFFVNDEYDKNSLCTQSTKTQVFVYLTENYEIREKWWYLPRSFCKRPFLSSMFRICRETIFLKFISISKRLVKSYFVVTTK